MLFHKRFPGSASSSVWYGLFGGQVENGEITSVEWRKVWNCFAYAAQERSQAVTVFLPNFDPCVGRPAFWRYFDNNVY
jgi:hypothetical protein